MAPLRSLLCFCEGVTIEDVERALEEGFRDLESLKRRLRVGMGPCQGRYCIPMLISYLSRKFGVPPERLIPPRVRPTARACSRVFVPGC
uniref:(2Fe-2S)-binding protein n=1 Tax=Thermofilum pendens TaxID=2269 RepID=A0A7C3SK98_THEPE